MGKTATEADIINALRKVREPELGKDLVSLNMVQDVKVCAGAASLTLVLTTPACPLKSEIEESARQAVLAVPGIERVDIKMTSNVTRSTTTAEDILPGVRNVVAVGSGKGGVGKSTVAVNLAAALAESHASVGLLDADIYGPSIPTMMGINRKPEVVEGKLIPLEQHRIRLMSLGFLLGDNAPVIWRGPMVAGAVRQMLSDVEWGELDYLIVDLPPGTGDAQLTLAQTVPLTGSVIVMTSQDVALNIATKTLQMFQRLNVPILGVIENMSTFICPHCGTATPIFSTGGGEKIGEMLDVPFLGSIPLEPRIVTEGDTGVPSVIAAPESAHADAFRKVARAMAARISVKTILGDAQADSVPSLKDRFQKLFNK
ncbi:MAG: Mrp/NBP35 family ATP-binding protein [Armatimonadetes bacterium]|nr:Mrp/NBP35 family ATP-binding protein [Armatimonadota bacterium]